MHPLVWIESGRTKFLRRCDATEIAREETAKCHRFLAISSRVAFPSFSPHKYNDTENVNKQYEGNTKALGKAFWACLLEKKTAMARAQSHHLHVDFLGKQ